MASLSDETEARMNDLLALSHSGGETDPMSYDDLMKSKLREKYDGLVSGLLEKVEIENKAYMDRKLESMEKDKRAVSFFKVVPPFFIILQYCT